MMISLPPMNVIRIEGSELFDDYQYRVTGLFYDLYNSFELSEDKGFIAEMLEKHRLDKTLYEYTVENVKMSIASYVEIIKEKQKKIDELKSDLEKLDKKKKLTKKENVTRIRTIKKLSSLEKAVNKDVCFGGKENLRNITRLKQKTKLTKKEKKNLDKTLNLYQKERKRNIYLLGKAVEGGNRKIDFHLKENYIVFKPEKGVKIEFHFSKLKSKKRIEILHKLQGLADNNSIPITVRLSKDKISLTYDNEILSGYGFKTTECNTKLKDAPKEKRKAIRKEFYDEQKERKLEGKVHNRAASVDMNPEVVGFSIVDIDGEYEVDNLVFKKHYDLSKYVNNEYTSKEAARINNIKHKEELIRIYKEIFNYCKHYKVAYFGYENLDNINNDTLNEKSRRFNRITKNQWHRNLQTGQIVKRSDNLGILHEDVKPEYSSFIGNMKTDLFDPVASSTEIARRAYVKFIKDIGSKWIYPSIDETTYEKMSYLLGENVNGKTWNSVYAMFKKKSTCEFGGWWRNPSENIKLCT